MIIDSSALVAIIFREAGCELLVDAIERADGAAVGAPTLAETGIVLSARLGARSHGLLERVLDELSIEQVPFGELHWREAVDAFRRYGKGRHRAALNFGDCLTYAVASLADEPVLFVGDDFSATDLRSAR
jgi:ribonuclease VapC